MVTQEVGVVWVFGVKALVNEGAGERSCFQSFSEMNQLRLEVFVCGLQSTGHLQE